MTSHSKIVDQGAIRDSKGARTRERIKQGFISALNDKSHANVTIDDICKKSGLTVGGFYFHFKSQQSLLDEVIAEYIDDLVADLEHSIVEDNFLSSVEGIVTTFMASYVKFPGLTRCFQQLVRVQTKYAHLWQERNRTCVCMLSSVIRQDQSEVSDAQSIFLAMSVISLAITAFNVHYFIRDTGAASAGKPHNTIVSTVVGICSRVIKSDKA